MRFRRAFTLIEVLISTALLGLIIVVVGELLHYGLIAHQKGEYARQGQVVARDIVQRITTEMGTGVALDTLYSDATHPQDFLSAVVWPDPYQNLSPTAQFSDPSYARTHLTGPNNLELDQCLNRVIFTRPGVDIGNTTFSDRDYSQFVYVEYVVPPPSPSGQGQHQLLRRVYRVATLPSGPPAGNDPNAGSFFRYIVPTFFKIDAWSDGDPLAIFNNANTNVAGLPPAQQAATTIVAELPNPTDRISITVQHARNLATIGVTDPAQLSRFAYFDPSLFAINVTISIGRQNLPPNENFIAVRSLSGQARVKSGE